MNQQLVEFVTQELSERVTALSHVFCPAGGGGQYFRWEYAKIIRPHHCVVVVEHCREDGTVFFRSAVLCPELHDDAWSMGGPLFSSPEEAFQDGLVSLLRIVECQEQDQRDFGPAAQAAKAAKQG